MWLHIMLLNIRFKYRLFNMWLNKIDSNRQIQLLKNIRWSWIRYTQFWLNKIDISSKLKAHPNSYMDGYDVVSDGYDAQFIYFWRSAVKCTFCIDVHLNGDFVHFDKSMCILCKIQPLCIFFSFVLQTAVQKKPQIQEQKKTEWINQWQLTFE